VSHRIHIFGASGCGTSTFGRHLAQRLDARFLDTDSYYWQATDPPFTTRNPPALRIEMIERDSADATHWVLSGSICSWGGPLLHHFTLAIFLRLDPELRMARLRAREEARYGRRIEVGGDMCQAHVEFMNWAASYDTARAPVRSLHMHEAWIEDLPCPVLRLDTSAPVNQLCDEVLDGL
jgi:adenylate kinase family enzyme